VVEVDDDVADVFVRVVRVDRVDPSSGMVVGGRAEGQSGKLDS
jgi:hypothetical protein